MANSSISGIKERCAFHEVNNFHIIQNSTVDVMYDVFVGVALYVMRAIIYNFVFVKQYFTLEFLNSRIKTFEFGSSENSSRPSLISIHRLKNKLNLKMPASEMLCFVRYIGLIIGDKVREDDELWKLYKYLRQIVDILTSPRIIRSDCNFLQKLIKDYNELYAKHFGKIKPKFHILDHYPDIILENGPSRQAIVKIC